MQHHLVCSLPQLLSASTFLGLSFSQPQYFQPQFLSAPTLPAPISFSPNFSPLVAHVLQLSHTSQSDSNSESHNQAPNHAGSVHEQPPKNPRCALLFATLRAMDRERIRRAHGVGVLLLQMHEAGLEASGRLWRGWKLLCLRLFVFSFPLARC